MGRVIFLMLIVFMLSIPAMAEEVTPPWKIKGSLAEGCSCEVACPCIFLSMPSNEPCQAILNFHIDEGNYGPTALKDLNLAMTADIEPGHSMAAGNWSAIAYYVDSKASSAQKEALEKIFMSIFSSLAPNSLGVKSVPISFEETADKKGSKVSIPEIFDLQIQLVPGTNPSYPSKINNPPFHPLPELLVAKSVVNRYKDYNLEWNYNGKSAFMGHFEFSGPKGASP